LVALSALILPVAQIASARPLAAQTKDGSSESGVVGNSYTSPNFGYSITWDRAWTVTDEQNGADGDSLTLSNDVSVVTLSGIEFPLDLQTCIDSFTQQFVDDEAVSDFGPRQTGDGPVGGEDDGRLWAVFDFTYTAEDSEPIDFSVYVDCRFNVEGESALIISSIVEGAAYES